MLIKHFNIKPFTLLLKETNYHKQIKRTMLHLKTQLTVNDKLVLQRMLVKFKQYVYEGHYTFDHQYTLCKSLLSMNVRMGQHLINAVFEKNTFLLSELQQAIKDKNLVVAADSTSTYIDDSVIVTAIQGEFLKKQPFFKKGTLHVEEPPKNKKNIDTTKAMEDTGQQFPDYKYIIKDDANYVKIKYYDLKSGINFKINKGHILCITDPKEFEDTVAKLLICQEAYYKKDNPEIGDFLEQILANKQNTSWTILNDQVHEFFLNILHKHPKSTPSLVFKGECSYDDNHIIVPKYIETIMSSYKVIHSQEDTAATIAQVIKKSVPDDIIQRFLKEPRHNKNIIKALGSYLDNFQDV